MHANTTYQVLDQGDVCFGAWRAIVLEGLYAGDAIDSAPRPLGLRGVVLAYIVTLTLK